MERLIRWGIVFLIAGCGAVACAGYGYWELVMARAIRLTATFDLGSADAEYAKLQRALERAGFVPGVFDSARTAVRDRRAELRYWQGDILGLTNEQEEPGNVQSPQRRFVQANARYRSLANQTDRNEYVRGLESCVNDYEQVIRADRLHFDAAYNYEFLLRELQRAKQGKQTQQQQQQQSQSKSGKGKKDKQEGRQQGQQSPNGMQGSEQQQEGMEKMKIIVPIDPQEQQDKSKEGPGAGKAVTDKKKG